MNKSHDTKDPKTDLELASNHSNHWTEKKLKNDSGAGANADAASRVDMLIVANPVSELVWSPAKGPRVKRANSCFVGPSHVFPPGQCIPGVMFNPKKPIYENSSLHRNNEAGRICEREETEMTMGLSVSHANQKDHTMNSSEKDIHDQAKLINSGVAEKNEPRLFAIPGHVAKETPYKLILEAEETSTDFPMNEQCGGIITSRNKILEADNIVACEIQHTFRPASSTPVTSSGRLPVEKEESAAENELQTVGDGSSPAAVGKLSISLSSHGCENKWPENALVLHCDQNSQPSCCPTSSRTDRYLKKCKRKALSDGDERISNEDDDSHESVESCNSAGQFSTVKRQQNSKQQSGSKRVKRPFQGTPDSPNSIRRDSSFMNWISNMMKGFSQLRPDEVTPPAPTFEHCNTDHEMLNQQLVKLSKDQYPGCSVGFQSIFQAIYSSSSKNTETRKLSVNQQLEDIAMNVELVRKVTSSTPMPIACYPGSGSCGEQILQSSKRFEGRPCPNEVVPLSEAKVPRNFVNDPENSRLNSSENKNSCGLEMSKEKERITSTSYFGEHEMKIGTDAVFEAMPTQINQRKDVCASLWITRFSSKSFSPGLDAHHLQISDAGCSKLPQATNSVTNDYFRTVEVKEHPTDEKLPSERRLLSGTVSNEYSGAKTANPSYAQKSVDDLNNSYHSLRLKSPEATTSLFARRLDVHKHNIPSNLEDDPTRANMTCFFCGVKGQQLCNCTEISGNGVKNLPKNMNPSEKSKACTSMHAEQSEVNPHPSEYHGVFSSGKHVSLANTSAHDNTSGIHVNAGNANHAYHIACKEGNCQSPTPLDVEKRLKEGIHSAQKLNRLLPDEKSGSKSSTQNKIEENALSHSRSSDEQQVSRVPKGIFEAIKNLQLSRSDILKWINSPMSATHLDGFFLRLRVGKWEEGLGTGYHVASITGSHRQSLVQNAKPSVSVNVKGVNCSVESQYISNHHFLEDEVLAWLSTTSKVGDNSLPSEKDLMERIKKKESLGF